MESIDSVQTTKKPQDFTADEIDHHLWVGDMDAAENTEALDTLNITHILSVLDFEPKYSDNKPRVRKHVLAFDMHTTHLINEFDSCYQFIDEAIRMNKNVLIHCLAGRSRSITVACAYLMKKYKISHNAALKQVRAKRSCATPNPGFLRQLRLYHSMKYSYKSGTTYDERSTSDDDGSVENDVTSTVTTNDDPYKVAYKCKSCRRTLFTDNELVAHIIGKGRFDSQARTSAYKAKQNAESSDRNYCQQELFTIEPLWMAYIYEKDTNNGEVICPNSKCQAKLGRYSLIGEKCTCATWVNPAFHFHRSKIDACPVAEK